MAEYRIARYDGFLAAERIACLCEDNNLRYDDHDKLQIAYVSFYLVPKSSRIPCVATQIVCDGGMIAHIKLGSRAIHEVWLPGFK